MISGPYVISSIGVFIFISVAIPLQLTISPGTPLVVPPLTWGHTAHSLMVSWLPPDLTILYLPSPTKPPPIRN